MQAQIYLKAILDATTLNQRNRTDALSIERNKSKVVRFRMLMIVLLIIVLLMIVLLLRKSSMLDDPWNRSQTAVVPLNSLAVRMDFTYSRTAKGSSVALSGKATTP